MNFWTINKLREVLPDAKFYGFADDFSCSGVCAEFTYTAPDKLHLMKKPDEKYGILEGFLDNPENRNNVSAIMCTDYERFKKYGFPVIEVEDPREAIYDMAMAMRKLYKGRVIGITGSAGKSTTTQICYDALKTYGASANLNRVNKAFGISWNMTNYDLNVPYWVNEVSQNRGMYPGARLVIPDVAVVTNIAAVHLKPDETLERVAKVKSRIFCEMKPGAVAVLNKDMEYYETVKYNASKKSLKIITFGLHSDADIQVITGEFSGINISGRIFKYSQYPVPVHILLDMAAVIGIFMGLGLPVDEKLFASLKEFHPIVGRGIISHGKFDETRSVTVLDESYNANPLSMRMTIEGFNQLFKSKPNKLLVLGEMSEGGAQTSSQHKSLASVIAEVKPSRVFLLGENMRVLYDELKNDYHCRYYDNVDDIIRDMPADIVNDDYVFIKGSHSTKLKKLVQFFNTKFEENMK